jgi:helicase
MTELDDEEVAAPLIAAARTLTSTAEHLDTSDSEDLHASYELRLYAALAHAMYGNFPSAKAASADIPDWFFRTSPMRLVAQLVLSPDRPFPEEEVEGMDTVNAFRSHWYWALRTIDLGRRSNFFASSMILFGEIAATAVASADKALALSIEVALEQAQRLAIVSLSNAAPEIPEWFVSGAIALGTLTLLPPQFHLLVRKRIARQVGNSLLTLPTSTGKTLVAEACLAASTAGGGFGIYVAPYVAIGEQVRASLRAKAEPNVPVKSMFGGFKREMVAGLSQALIVMTPERLDAWLRTAGPQLELLRLVVFDEIHVIENDGRGARIEGIITRLRLMQRRLPSLQLIGLSAVLVMPERICQWMGVPEANLHRITWRPTARRLAICRQNGDLQWVHGNDPLRPNLSTPDAPISEPVRVHIPNYVRPHRNPSVFEEDASANIASVAMDLRTRLGEPGLVVCPRKADTRMLAAALAENMEELGDAEVLRVAREISSKYSWLSGLSKCLARSVAFHNASIPYDVRREIERLTRERRLSIVCSTTTLAEGADLPFRWTLISNWLGPDGLPMKSMTFRNIAGRSGRAGAFTEGDTILFENGMGPPESYRGINLRNKLNSVMFSSAPVASAFGDGFGNLSDHKQIVVTSVISSQLIAAIGENPDHENLGSAFADATYANVNQSNSIVRDIVSFQVLSLLDQNEPGGALAVMNSPIKLTALGEAVNQTGFSSHSARRIVEFLSQYQENPLPSSILVDLLGNFASLPEQSSELWQKIVFNPKHRFPFKKEDAATVLMKIINRRDLRTIFEELPARLKSKAQQKNIEKQFDQFVSLIDALVYGFLPWLLRALAALAPFGSEAGQRENWLALSSQFETVEVDDSNDGEPEND